MHLGRSTRFGPGAPANLNSYKGLFTAAEVKIVATPQGEEVRLKGRPIRWSDFQELLINSVPLRAALTHRLRNDPKTAFYFECTPWFASSDPVFRFALTPAPGLTSRKVDAASFSSHFVAGEGPCRTFRNLRGESTLVVPAPDGANEGFGHLASWLRTASEAQIDDVWRATGVAIADWRRNSGALWLSTSGGGVAWRGCTYDWILGPSTTSTTRFVC